MMFVVKGIPKALKRARVSSKGTFYDPSKKDKQDFLLQCKNHAPGAPLKGEVRIWITFYFKRPKSHYVSNNPKNKLKNTAPVAHTSKPDLDNLVKFVLDALNGSFYIDDSQIHKIEALKKYHSENNSTQISIVNL